MQIKEIISKGIEGGWDKKRALYHDWQDLERGQMSMEKMWLDPKFWEAVGKVEGWKIWQIGEKTRAGNNIVRQGSSLKMHEMINHLCSGGTIKSFIKSL